MLVDDAGMPLQFANRYTYSMIEKPGRSLSSIKKTLYVISRLYLWAEIRGVDLKQLLYHGDLKWEKFCRVHGEMVGHQFTKMAFNKEKSGRVRIAYQDAKNRLRGKSLKAAALTPEEQKIANLEAKIEVLKRENANLLDRFRCWQHNARIKGVTFEELDRPLPNLNNSR